MLAPLLFVLYTREMIDVVENVMFNYADDSTLVAAVKCPGDIDSVLLTVETEASLLLMNDVTDGT